MFVDDVKNVSQPPEMVGSQNLNSLARCNTYVLGTPNVPVLLPPDQEISKEEDPLVKQAGKVFPPEHFLKQLTHLNSVIEMHM